MSNLPPSIPRKSIPGPSYAVHRPSNSQGESSSPNSDPNQVPYHDEPEHDERPNTPPPYSGPTSPSSRPAPSPNPLSSLSRGILKIYPGLPRLNYPLYSPSSFTLSSDHTTLTTQSRHLNTYPLELLSLVQALATVPPKPTIRILGVSPHGTVDFDVRINVLNLIVPEDEKRRLNYVRTVGSGEIAFRGETRVGKVPSGLDLEGWCKRFCEDGSAIKQFTLERTIINWDTSYLEGRLLSLISATGYRGHTTVTFPLTHSKVVINSPDRINSFFSDVTKVFTGTRKYEIVKSVWPYADVARGEIVTGDGLGSGTSNTGRRVAVQDEEEWFIDWKDPIRQAVLSKRNGWCTVEDRLEYLMEPKLTTATW